MIMDWTPKLVELCNFEKIKSDQEHRSYIWFEFHGAIFAVSICCTT